MEKCAQTSPNRLQLSLEPNLGLEDSVGLLDVPEHLHDRLLQTSLPDLVEEEVVGHDRQLAQLPLHVLPTGNRLAREDFRPRWLRPPEQKWPQPLRSTASWVRFGEV